jgi:hypothetical protein
MDPQLRRSLYSLMLVAATGLMVARIANVEFLYEPSLYKAYPARKWPAEAPTPQPTFGSNDRARWATVKAFVENDTYVIGHRVPDARAKNGYRDVGILFTPGFGSVDVVLHPKYREFYSTKPPLLTQFAAAQYWVIHRVFKRSISEHRWETVVPILLITNVLPLVIALRLLSRLLEWYGKSDWGRLFLFATACFGTFLTTFVTTLNNHVPAACCVMYAAYAVLAPVRARQQPLPPGGIAPPDGQSPEQSNRALRDPVRLLQAGLFAGLAACMDLPAAAVGGMLGLLVLRFSWKGMFWFVPALLLPIAVQTYLNYVAIGIWEPAYSKFGTEWYEYPGSHWEKRHWPKEKLVQQIDFLDEPKHVYAFHLLFGHHGLFSLTPVWLIALAGIGMRFGGDRVAAWMHFLSFPIVLVVVAFYIFATNNYGGWTSGPRWLFWLTPLFLLALLPAADWLGRWRLGRVLGYLCLGVSAFSATYPWANPWRHPWIYQLLEYKGLVQY